MRQDLVSALMDAGRLRGVEVDEKNAANTAASILAAMDGLQLQWLLDPDEVDLSETTEYVIRSLVAQVFNPGKQIL